MDASEAHPPIIINLAEDSEEGDNEYDGVEEVLVTPLENKPVHNEYDGVEEVLATPLENKPVHNEYDGVEEVLATPLENKPVHNEYDGVEEVLATPLENKPVGAPYQGVRKEETPVFESAWERGLRQAKEKLTNKSHSDKSHCCNTFDTLTPRMSTSRCDTPTKQVHRKHPSSGGA
uniref:Uncharacterized protein n=1 Tax=Timema cristinae TaxID=61476 RepID=A0A7R9H6P4_TIMCR|nr:unnamed protein product [Timema cristinae]